ncbi:hypothetical protein ED312_08585 [Sinomicrobium pectinilyticum]|uniref:Uncharacterized protein n=1 Tax=Sinomicrobium pectinilyticum TaxID=1084421 RepID=A0A3N0EKT9_SINP1|nr:hypothetical protein [Sinomicrobium pectinilyticum]RNL88495.1 hypothetical protein ED312_08585 [Sinomicrobium pectinilyticum]
MLSITNTDVTTQVNWNVHTEGRSADGIVQIPTLAADDEAAKKAANTEISNRKKYMLVITTVQQLLKEWQI